MDLADQFAAVWARRATVLLAALMVAAAVFAWRAAGPEEYRASTTLQVRLPGTDASDPSAQVEYYAETVIGLLTSRSVVADALAAVGRSEDPEEVAERVDVQAGAEPGFVEVTADGESARGAADLADALVAAVDTKVIADQAADLAAERDLLTGSLAEVLEQLYATPTSDNAARAALIREREELISALRSNADHGAWRVAIVESAELPSDPVAPTPERDALLAFLIALILLAEGIVIRRAWRGAVSARDPAGDVREATGATAVTLGPRDGVEAVAALLPQLAGSSRITVAHLGGRRPDARAAVLLARLLAARGNDVLLVDATPDSPSVHRALGVDRDQGLSDVPRDRQELSRWLRELPTVSGFRVLTSGLSGGPVGGSPRKRLARVVGASGADQVVVAVSGRRLDELMSLVSDGSEGALVLVVEHDTATRRALHQAAAAVRGLGVTLAGAVVTVGR